MGQDSFGQKAASIAPQKSGKKKGWLSRLGSKLGSAIGNALKGSPRHVWEIVSRRKSSTLGHDPARRDRDGAQSRIGQQTWNCLNLRTLYLGHAQSLHRL
jgi:hypothetical protein